MNAGDQLDIALSRRVTAKLVREIRIKAVRCQRIILREPSDVLLVLHTAHCAGAVNQSSSRSHIADRVVEDPPLQFLELLDLSRGNPVFDICLSADHAETRTGQVTYNDIRLLLGFLIMHESIHDDRSDIDEIRTGHILNNQSHFFFREVSGFDHAVRCHLIRYVKALSTGSRTHVNDIISLSRTGCLSHQHRAYILRKDQAFHKSVQSGQIIII